MASQGVVGEGFTFQVLYLDGDNLPLAVLTSKITVFRFSSAGARQVLVDDADMDEVVPAEVGRYTYKYVIPSTVVEGTVLYGEMEAVDPVTDDRLISEQVVNVIARAIGTGLTARFIQ